VSYRRAGGHALAGRLAEHLRERFPMARIFFDIDSIMVGSDFATTIQQDLHGARLTVVEVAQLRGRVTYTLQIDNSRGTKVFSLAPPTGGFSAFDDARRPYEAYLSDTS
jgi:hypothetical protein